MFLWYFAEGKARTIETHIVEREAAGRQATERCQTIEISLILLALVAIAVKLKKDLRRL